MTVFRFVLITLLSATLFGGCNGNGPQLKQNISGKAGEIIIVTNKANWESESGAEMRSILAADYPFLPQREPAFNLINIGEKNFDKLFQIHRNIVIMQVNPEFTEAKMVAQEDIWAAPQIVVTITAPTEQAATALLKEKSDLLYNTISQAERNRIIRNSKIYEERDLRRIVSEEFGGSPYFPKGYSIKKKAENFMWISYETTYTNQGIFVYRIPYKDSTSMNVDNLIAARNEMLARNVPGQLDNSYMTTSGEKTPALHWMKYKKRDFAEVRGLWEVQNDFMGGPFVSHAFYDKDSANIIVLEGFVYAPRYDKRNYLRQVESMLYSFDWKEDFNK
ncbi:MAG: DUF4837 family protein [Bacteroidales bacterium]